MKLSDIKGLKNKRLALLEKEGILTPMDLLSFFPVRYVDTRNLTDFSVVADGEDAAFLAQFRAPVKTNYVRKNLCIVREKFICGQTSLYCVWYNQRYFASSVLPGVDYYIIGKTLAEIAKETQLHITSVQRTLANIKQKVQQKYTEQEFAEMIGLAH